jgi:hypothetical protein
MVPGLSLRTMSSKRSDICDHRHQVMSFLFEVLSDLPQLLPSSEMADERVMHDQTSPS